MSVAAAATPASLVADELLAYLRDRKGLSSLNYLQAPQYIPDGWETYIYRLQFLSPNHDICKLPNGNVLINVWEKKSAKEAIAAGRWPETVGQGDMLSAALLEVQPTGEKTGKIVWEWYAWDHLIQEFDDKQVNHGDVAAHPERIDLNFGEATIPAMVAKPEELEKLRSIGYVGAPGRKPQVAQPDCLHINSVAYNPDLDQIMLSAFEFSEIWIIDHGTTTAEAASRQGGKGGDLLYRWGNPRAYRAGAVKNQKLFGQHNAHWIPKGLLGFGPPGGFPGFGPPGGAGLFRAPRYAADFPGLRDKELKPGKTIEELQQGPPK